MNKQELIERIDKLPYVEGPIADTVTVNREWILKSIEQLDEPQKVKVSEEEAKFLETFDFNCESDVTTALYHVSRTGWGYYLRDNNGIDLKDLSEGFIELENRKRLIKAILDGYEVEQEKRYYVRFKGMESGDFNYLNFIKFQHAWVLSSIKLDKKFRTEHTKKQLEEAGFGWVFDCEGIEIEEVEG